MVGETADECVYNAVVSVSEFYTDVDEYHKEQFEWFRHYLLTTHVFPQQYWYFFQWKFIMLSSLPPPKKKEYIYVYTIKMWLHFSALRLF